MTTVKSDQPTQILKAEFKTGYIIRNFVVTNSVRALPELCFNATTINSQNCTTDMEYFASSILFGEEINLKWVSTIPREERDINLRIDYASIKNTFNKIKKKESATIEIGQYRNGTPIKMIKDETTGKMISTFLPQKYNRFVIYLSSGADKREGYKSISANNVSKLQKEVLIPNINSSECYTLSIPITPFRNMITQFTQCKSGKIELMIHIMETQDYGRIATGLTLRTIKPTGIEISPIVEKYGDIDELDLSSQDTIITSNKYVFSYDKISHFSKFASVYPDGTVRFYWQEGYHLLISTRIGGFGECSVCLHNKIPTSSVPPATPTTITSSATEE